jgi:hypothetical protein
VPTAGVPNARGIPSCSVRSGAAHRRGTGRGEGGRRQVKECGANRFRRPLLWLVRNSSPSSSPFCCAAATRGAESPPWSEAGLSLIRAARTADTLMRSIGSAPPIDERGSVHSARTLSLLPERTEFSISPAGRTGVSNSGLRSSGFPAGSSPHGAGRRASRAEDARYDPAEPANAARRAGRRGVLSHMCDRCPLRAALGAILARPRASAVM